MAKTDSEFDTYSDAETVARREAALKRAFAMPHKPHKPLDRAKRSKSAAKTDGKSEKHP